MNDEKTLFTMPEQPENIFSEKTYLAKPRLNYAIRNQVEMITRSLDQTLSKDHLARDHTQSNILSWFEVW